MSAKMTTLSRGSVMPCAMPCASSPGLDPKKVELAFGRECWDEYADTVEDMVALLEKAVNELLERNKQIQGKARKITPSPEMPLNVIVIDELAYLSALVPDKKLRDRAQAAIGTILLLGRATGYCLTACTQDVRKEVIGFRDYFPTKVALGMPAPMVDLCLGEGAWENNAKAEQIPLREAGAGCAFVLEETSNKPLLVRAAWCSDEAVRMMLTDPQAFGVESDNSLRQYEQGYAGADTSAQSKPDGQPTDAGQLRWEELPSEVQQLALQYAQQRQLRQE
jgi:DNA segregation ATPase FtsK/SpoIIIE-like protein